MCVDWNGFVAPCVFMPYSPVNINDVYAQGKTLSDAWAEPFLAGVRNWQKQYDEAHGNLMMPCPMRDHHADLRRILAEHEPEPVDENARAALLDPEYAHRLAEYDATYEQISAPLWQEHYMRPRAPSDGDIPPLPDLAQTASVVRSCRRLERGSQPMGCDPRRLEGAARGRTAYRPSRRKTESSMNDGTRPIFWLDLVILLLVAALVLLHQWDYVLALVIGLGVMNYFDRFHSRRG